MQGFQTRQQVPRKCWQQPKRLHSVKTKKTTIHMFATLISVFCWWRENMNLGLKFQSNKLSWGIFLVHFLNAVSSFVWNYSVSNDLVSIYCDVLEHTNIPFLLQKLIKYNRTVCSTNTSNLFWLHNFYVLRKNV